MSKIKVNEIEKASGSGITIPTGTSFTITDGLASSSLPTVPVTKGGTGLTSLGSANQVLRTNSSANALEFGTIASDFVHILTQTVSSAVGTVDFKNGVNGCVFDNTYKFYRILITGLTASSGTEHLRMRFMSGDTVRSSGYKSSGYRSYYDGSAQGDDRVVANDHCALLNCNTSTNLANGHTNADINIYDPSSSATQTSYSSVVHGSDTSYSITQISGGYYDTTEANTGVSFYVNGVNTASGTFSLYGIKN
jgi:hypothetical protein